MRDGGGVKRNIHGGLFHLQHNAIMQLNEK